MKYLLFFMALLVGIPSWGAITLKQVNGAESPSTQSTLSVAFSSANTAGCTIIVAAGAPGTSTTLAVSDTAGNTYAGIPNTAKSNAAAGIGYPIEIFYAKNILAGANTVKLTLNQSEGYIRLLIHEFCGLDPTSPLDQSDSTYGGGGGTVYTSVNGVTTTAANELIFAWGVDNSGVTSAGSGYTLLQTVASESTEYRIVSSIGTYGPTFPESSNSWIGAVATFKQASAVVVKPSPIGF